MAGWIETELKLLLPDVDSWRRVRDALGAGSVVVQANHFFDRGDRVLAMARIAVRLRAEDGRRQLTVKGDELGTPGRAVSRRIELETEMSAGDFDASVAKGLDLLPWIPLLEAQAPSASRSPELQHLLDTLRIVGRTGPLVRIDGFSNRRERCRLELSDERGSFEVDVDLDETRFSADRIDHELEIELDAAEERDAPGHRSPQQVERALRQWLRELAGIEVMPAPSKLERLRALRQTAT